MHPPNTNYPAFILAQQEFKLGDSVTVKRPGVNKGKNDFVAKVERIYTNAASQVNIDVCWFYRPEELPCGRKPYHGRDEVITSDHRDTVKVETINSKAVVHTIEAYEQRDSTPLHNAGYIIPEFFSRSFYHYKEQHLKEPTDKYCTCRQPHNPDKLMICCDECESWFHPKCVRMDESLVSSLTTWRCASCSTSQLPSKRAKPQA
eukprot:m.94862 g.94862  ORF g.94862 m.94862 type:complete len:204 (-) comp15006_c0_seq1:1453-2064(-)